MPRLCQPVNAIVVFVVLGTEGAGPGQGTARSSGIVGQKSGNLFGTLPPFALSSLRLSAARSRATVRSRAHRVGRR